MPRLVFNLEQVAGLARASREAPERRIAFAQRADTIALLLPEAMET